MKSVFAYHIRGEISIPEHKKTELNTEMIQLLYKGGIRSIVYTELDGRSVKCIKPPEPDEHGSVSFSYSIFDRRQDRWPSEYNTRSCELTVLDGGTGAFALIMVAAMTLICSCSATPCYVCHHNSRLDTSGYNMLLNRFGLYHGKEMIPELPLYRVMGKDNEDEFLEYWTDGTPVPKLSDGLISNLVEWDRLIKGPASVCPDDVGKVLADDLLELQKNHFGLLPDIRMIEEIMINKDDDRYQSFVGLLHHYLTEHCLRFPELTKAQVKLWLSERLYDKDFCASLSALMGLFLSRSDHRGRILGF